MTARRWLVAALGLSALGLSFPLMLFGAALPRTWLFVAGAAASYAGEAYIYRYQQFVVRALSKVNLGITLRFFVRDSLLLVLVARLGHLSDFGFVLFAVGMLGLQALRGAHSVLTYRIQRRRFPVELHNVEAPRGLPGGPPEFLMREGLRKMLHLDMLPVAGALYGGLTQHYLPMAVLTCIALAAGLAADGVLGQHYLRIHRVPAETAFNLLHEQVISLRPEVILYFSGSPESAYQLNMWLSVLDRLPHKTLILLRERSILSLIAPTKAPVACIVGSIDLMNFSLPDARLAMYVANVGKNIHLLRVPGIRHVFIGHGDSDKQASVNPFSKVYDEVWVAGAAGRERWAKANVGVRDESVREVGRPQLDPIATLPGAGPREVKHVLYAPTWEGWTNDPFHTSLVLMGPELVRDLITHDSDVVVTYKPHPLTGTRDRRALRAHEEIVSIIRGANAKRATTAQHAVVLDDGPNLYECFNRADLLISDISSVVADFIHSQKPYVVTNPEGVDDARFRKLNPTASAAYLVGPGGDTISNVLAAVAAGDPLADDRRRLKEFLLGPDEPSAMERFSNAVEEVVAQGVAAPAPGDLEFGFEPEPDTESLLGGADDGDGDGGGGRRLAVG
ncbi:MAG: CDP-glycerol glycerophosphotransferase family protein [Actinomycetes bacterium]